MKTVTIQFCSFPTLVGETIEWFTQGLCGHVDAVMPDGSLLGAQQESDLGGKPSGVQIRPSNYGGMTHRLQASFSCTTAQAETFYSFLQAQVGKPYDLTAIAAFVAGRDWHDRQAWFCSELIAAALEEADIIRKLVDPLNKITPATLLVVASALVPVQAA